MAAESTSLMSLDMNYVIQADSNALAAIIRRIYLLTHSTFAYESGTLKKDLWQKLVDIKAVRLSLSTLPPSANTSGMLLLLLLIYNIYGGCKNTLSSRSQSVSNR